MTEPAAEKTSAPDDWKSFYANPPSPSPELPSKRQRWAAFRGLPWWQRVLSLVPLVLIGLGGLLGGAIGGGATLVNLRIARSSMSSAAKAVSMIVIIGLAFVLWTIVTAIIVSAIGVE